MRVLTSIPEIAWPLRPGEPTLDDAEVHVWAFVLHQPPEKLAPLAELLSEDERARAVERRAGPVRDHYIAGRGGLRLLVGRYLRLAPERLQFAYGRHGKPELAGAEAGALHFNLAHSGGLALLAVTRAAPLGVDVERVRPMRDAAQLAERFFSPRESAALKQIPAAELDAAFFQLWTRKEAFVKVSGAGITASLSKFEVTFRSEVPPRVVVVDGDPIAGAVWTLCGLSPAAGYVGALAVPAPRMRACCWRLEF